LGNYIVDESSPKGDDEDGAEHEREPKRLWSLLEIVHHFCAPQMAFLLEQLALMRRALTEKRKAMRGGAEPEPQFIEGYRRLISLGMQYCFVTHLAAGVQIGRLNDDQKLDLSTMIAGLNTIHDSIYEEMGRRKFLFVAEDRAGYLEGPPQIEPFRPDVYHEHTFWGNEKGCSIRAAAADVKAAGNCLAAECHTAAVFHAMRVAEHGIRVLAKRVNVSLTHKGKPQPVEYATWDKVITGIKNRLTVISQLPHTQKRQEQLARYSDLADRCLYMKDLWRNDLMHTRLQFNRLEAAGVLQRVREFMQAIQGKRR